MTFSARFGNPNSVQALDLLALEARLEGKVELRQRLHGWQARGAHGGLKTAVAPRQREGPEVHLALASRRRLETHHRLHRLPRPHPAHVVPKLFGLAANKKTRDLAERALESEFRTYYFKRDGIVDDISDLDPGSDDIAEGGWGGLTEFSSKVGNVVAEVANRTSAETS